MQLFDLYKIPENLLSRVGGKARGLYLLAKNNFSVPDGFIVYSPDGNIQQAVDYYKKKGLGKVAVRSSATNEDGVEYSSAGQFSTFLDVDGEGLQAAIENCISSLNNETARSYARTFLKNESTQMTVVVQEMVQARCAGVLFTRDPSDNGKMLIETVEGCGENLVSGAKAAQPVRVDFSSGEYTLPEKSLLTDAHVQQLALGAKRAEEIFGKPMDMEWAIDGKGSIRWLQARPITVEEMPSLHEFDSTYDVTDSVLTTCNIREMMPGAVTPLCLSTNMYALDYGLRKVIHKVGATKNLDDLPPYSCFLSYGNHMFMNLSGIYSMCHVTFGAYKEAVDLSICGRVLKDFPDVKMKSPNFFKRYFNTFVYLKYAMSGKGAKKGIQKIADEISFDLTQDEFGLYKQAEEKLPLLNETMYYHYWSSFYSGAQSNILMMMLDPKNEDDGTLLAELAGALTEIDGIESVDILRSMYKIVGAMLKNDPAHKNDSVEQVRAYLRSPDPETKQYLTEFMQKHGHRGICEPEMRNLPYAKDDLRFAEDIHLLLVNGEKEKLQTKHWQEYRNELLSGVKGIKKKVYSMFVNNARKGVFDREYTKARFIYVLDKFKDVYRLLGEKLAQKKQLPDADCIYFLTHQEIGRLMQGEVALVKKAIARRRLYDRQQTLRYAEVSLGKPKEIERVEVDENASRYQGTPVSRGVVRGKARIVRSIADANQLQSGEIMVAGYTDIGWSPYYGIAGGLITEVGSALSHGVVVAREYALPTVVNVEGALQVIKNGDMLTLNGDNGTVSVERA